MIREGYFRARVLRVANGLLEKSLGTAPTEGLTSHGMKATTLSWMTKAGYPESSCLILGHHSRGKKKSLCTYGRDVQAKPLRELCECLGLIKKGIFVPDATRSGMDESVPSGTMPEQSPDVAEQQEDEAGISNSSDESDSSGSSESDSVEYDRLPPPSSLDIAAPSIDQGLDLDVFRTLNLSPCTLEPRDPTEISRAAERSKG